MLQSLNCDKFFQIFLILVGLTGVYSPSWGETVKEHKSIHQPITEDNIQTLKTKFADLLKAQGFTPKVIYKASNLYSSYLLNILQPDFKNNVDWERIEFRLEYWKNLFALDRNGKGALNEFIYKSKEANPFSFLEVELKIWKTAADTLVRLNVFSSLNGYEIKSLKSYFLQQESFEGIKELSLKPISEWKMWEQVFRQAKTEAEALGNLIWRNVLKDKTPTQSGLRNLNQILSTSLVETLNQNLSIINYDILLTIFKTKPLTLIANSAQIADLFAMVKRYPLNNKKQSLQFLNQELNELFKKFENQQALERKGPKSLKRSCRLHLYN